MSFYCWSWPIPAVTGRSSSFYWKAYYHIQVAANVIWTTNFPLRKITKQIEEGSSKYADLSTFTTKSSSSILRFWEEIPTWFALRSQSLAIFSKFGNFCFLSEKPLRRNILIQILIPVFLRSLINADGHISSLGDLCLNMHWRLH